MYGQFFLGHVIKKQISYAEPVYEFSLYPFDVLSFYFKFWIIAILFY